MPQIFHVLRCFSCSTFQVHQVKKCNKYNCKMCAVKQSVTKVYGQGSGAECRKMVQQLNMYQGEKEAVIAQSVISRAGHAEVEETATGWEHQDHLAPAAPQGTSQNSKWNKYGPQDESLAQPVEEDDSPNFTTSWGDFAGSGAKAGKNRGQRQKPYTKQNPKTTSSSFCRKYDNTFDSGHQQRWGGEPMTRQNQSGLNRSPRSAKMVQDGSRYQQTISGNSETVNSSSSGCFQTKLANFSFLPGDGDAAKTHAGGVSSLPVSPDSVASHHLLKRSLEMKQNCTKAAGSGQSGPIKSMPEIPGAVHKKNVTDSAPVSSSSKWSKYANIVDENNSDEDDEDIGSVSFDNNPVLSQSPWLTTASKLPGQFEDCGSDPYASSQDSVGDVLCVKDRAETRDGIKPNFGRLPADQSDLNNSRTTKINHTGKRPNNGDNENGGVGSRTTKWGKYESTPAAEHDSSEGVSHVLKEAFMFGNTHNLYWQT